MENTIKVHRAMKDVTQEELAREIGVTRQTISALERGRYNPSLELAYRSADYFECSVEELFPESSVRRSTVAIGRPRTGRSIPSVVLFSARAAYLPQ
nr:helix-turn-helix transcriptional regulator [Halosolutus gelatinilyticus]